MDLEVHAGYRRLRAFYELGVKPSAHAEAEDIIIGVFGIKGEQSEAGGLPAGCAVPNRTGGASPALMDTG